MDWIQNSVVLESGMQKQSDICVPDQVQFQSATKETAEAKLFLIERWCMHNIKTFLLKLKTFQGFSYGITNFVVNSVEQ